jgi:hypothetical protein
VVAGPRYDLEAIFAHYGYLPYWAPGYVYPPYPHYRDAQSQRLPPRSDASRRSPPRRAPAARLGPPCNSRMPRP